ncbi:MAG: hypothetical protein ACI85V_003235 [bacterium]|jgi:hypothetical protein
MVDIPEIYSLENGVVLIDGVTSAARRAAILSVKLILEMHRKWGGFLVATPRPDIRMAQEKSNCSLGKRAVLHDIDAPFLGMIRVPHRRDLTKPLPNTFVHNSQNCDFPRVVGF